MLQGSCHILNPYFVEDKPEASLQSDTNFYLGIFSLCHFSGLLFFFGLVFFCFFFFNLKIYPHLEACWELSSVKILLCTVGVTEFVLKKMC